MKRRAAAVLVAGLASSGHACGSIPENLWAWTEYYARGFGLDPHLLAALVWTESRYCPQAVSSAGAVGLGQLMPGTARELGVTDSRDPVQNLYGAARYLRERWDQFQDWNLALAAYNAGPGNVLKYGRTIPPFRETQNYVVKVLDTYVTLKGTPGRNRPAAFAKVPTAQAMLAGHAQPPVQRAAQAAQTRVASAQTQVAAKPASAAPARAAAVTAVSAVGTAAIQEAPRTTAGGPAQESPGTLALAQEEPVSMIAGSAAPTAQVITLVVHRSARSESAGGQAESGLTVIRREVAVKTVAGTEGEGAQVQGEQGPASAPIILEVTDAAP